MDYVVVLETDSRVILGRGYRFYYMKEDGPRQNMWLLDKKNNELPNGLYDLHIWKTELAVISRSIH